MFAIVNFKDMDVDKIIPLAWVYNYHVENKLQKKTMVAYYSSDNNDLAPDNSNTHSNGKHQIPQSGHFYKVYVIESFGKLY